MNTTNKPQGAASGSGLTESCRPDRLLADLARVAQMLRDQVQPERAEASMTALVRLVPGLNLPNWREISRGELDQDWIALDLNSARAQADEHSGMDSLTGMLLPEAFARVLDLAMQDCRQNGLTLSLLLMQIDEPEAAQTKQYALALRTISSQMWDSASEQDKLGRLSANLFALALPGCSPFQARAMAENIIIRAGRDLQSQGLGPSAIRAGIVSQPRGRRQTISARDLLAKAGQSLALTSTAKDAELKQRINMEKDAAVEQALDTLVLADEKQFLFTGGF